MVSINFDYQRARLNRLRTILATLDAVELIFDSLAMEFPQYANDILDATETLNEVWLRFNFQVEAIEDAIGHEDN